MRETCRNGHDRTPNNTYIHKGREVCRVCNAAAAARYKSRRRTASNPEEYLVKNRARSAVYYAIRGSGRLTRSDKCEMANDHCQGEVQAHHEDYSKKLEVSWLCVFHHHLIHQPERS